MSFGQGGPEWGPGGSQGSHTPDWAALAEASEARNRRRKWLMIGGGALATALVAGIVAVAVVSANGSNQANKPGELPTEDIPNDSGSPAPSFSKTTAPPPPDPKEFISSAKKDKAPLSVNTLFPGKTFTKGAAVYKKGAQDTTKDCASATQGALGDVLTANDCEKLLRTTYVKDGIAVTVGVAVFENKKLADKTKDEWTKGNVTALPGSGVPAFCTSSVCFNTVNAYGRYAYFTTAGFTNGKPVTDKAKKVFTSAKDIESLAFGQIHKRGQKQASAAAGLG